MFKRTQKFSFAAVLVFGIFVSGCSTTKTNIFARDNGTYFVTSRSSDMIKARKAALEAANNYCLKLGKRFISMNDDGPSQWEQASNTREPESAWDHVKQNGSAEKNAEEDWDNNSNTPSTPEKILKVTIDFRCI